MWDHASDCLVEDAGWGAEMEGAASGWVVAGDLAEVGVVLDCSQREHVSRERLFLYRPSV